MMPIHAMKWRWGARRAQEWRGEAREHIGDGANLRLILITLGVVAIFMVALGIYWSREPAPFAVNSSVQAVLHEAVSHSVAGAVTAATLEQIVTTLLDKPGGFINNDI